MKRADRGKRGAFRRPYEPAGRGQEEGRVVPCRPENPPERLIVSQFEVRLTPSPLMSRAKLIIFLNSI